MKREIELLAPGGDIDSIKAAIIAGANAVYCGLDKFNARNRAANISFDDLQGVLRLAHKNDCQVFLTLNIIIIEREIPALIDLLNKLVNTSIDGIIVQDLGLFYLLSKYFKKLKIHASTQVTTHNEGQVNFLSKLCATQVNLSRELNINEIADLTTIAHKNKMLTEVFVHGSNCISFSGLCYISSVHSGNSGNRGRCSQACRDRYATTEVDKNYPLNLKDNSTFFDLKELAEAGVDSLKIEGRIKKFDYIYTVVSNWRRQLQSFYKHNKLSSDNSELYKVFNRDFSNSYLKGNISKDMFIDNPRDNSIKHLSDINNYATSDAQEQGELNLYKEKDEIKSRAENKIKQLSIENAPLIIDISGEYDAPLKISIKTPDTSFVVISEVNLTKAGADVLDKKMILKRLKALNDTEYYIKEIRTKNLRNNLIIPFKELTSIKKKILFVLNDYKEIIEAIKVPILNKKPEVETSPTISVLISSKKDLQLCSETTANIYFLLPNSFKNNQSELLNLFTENRITPWFPSILIGNNYDAAIEFLQKLQPGLIVTDNLGIAYEADRLGISWIAGPHLNIVNSYSLLCLKEKLNCSGSFISNEINKIQIKQIKCPEDFELYYSIYHPILLMTSRQCLFHQVTGCEKDNIDAQCIEQCKKSSTITDLKKNALFIEKSKGNYNNIYNETNFLNTEIVSDLPNIFTSFFIDLRDIKTNTVVSVDKSKLIKLFQDFLNENHNSKKELHQNIYPTTFNQYKKGI